jgi:hypothetical protein
MDDTREKVEECRTEYNEVRPHAQSVTGRRYSWSFDLSLSTNVDEVPYRPEILS